MSLGLFSYFFAPAAIFTIQNQRRFVVPWTTEDFLLKKTTGMGRDTAVQISKLNLGFYTGYIGYLVSGLDKNTATTGLLRLMSTCIITIDGSRGLTGRSLTH